ncbi:MAG: thioredoxin [Planctomycetes bacterium]|nr:thioredoxin [Planctomycetota bacterium]
MRVVRISALWILAVALVGSAAVGLVPSEPPEGSASPIGAFALQNAGVTDGALKEADIAALAAAPSPGDNTTPLALAFIDIAGKVMSGTSNVMCTRNAAWKYEITITGETYVASQYVTVATASKDAATMVTESANGKLIVSGRDQNGETIATAFQFITYKPQPLPDRPADWGKVVTVTAATFDGVVLASDKPVFVFFYTDWCPYCPSMVPIVEELALDYADRVKFVKINLDLALSIGLRYGVDAIPTFVTFKGGQKQQVLVGTRTKSQLIAAINPLL